MYANLNKNWRLEKCRIRQENLNVLQGYESPLLKGREESGYDLSHFVNAYNLQN